MPEWFPNSHFSDVFKNVFRNTEFHKFSAVRAVISEDEWNHLQNEENTVKGTFQMDSQSIYLTKTFIQFMLEGSSALECGSRDLILLR
jgi:hypothetical protein